MKTFWGKVRKVNQRGKTLGFPTANVFLKKIIPEGIYISKTKIKNKKFQSLTFIGEVKTFNESRYQSETYILDFDKNIYDYWISVRLIKKIRDNQKFDSAEKLVEQIKKDEDVARQFFVGNLPLD